MILSRLGYYVVVYTGLALKGEIVTILPQGNTQGGTFTITCTIGFSEFQGHSKIHFPFTVLKTGDKSVLALYMYLIYSSSNHSAVHLPHVLVGAQKSAHSSLCKMWTCISY